MKSAKYNKSEIMKQAWTMFRTSIYGYETFAQALRMAWYYAKREAERLAQIEARKAAMVAEAAAREAAKVETKRDRFYKDFNKTIAREYRNGTFGKNDWRVSYGRRYY